MNDWTLIDKDGDNVGRYALAGDYEHYVPCGHAGCDWAFEDGDGPAIRSHRAEHRDACIDITINHRSCEFCSVTKDDQINAYLQTETIDRPFCDPDAQDEDGEPATCIKCQRDTRGRQVTKCGSLYPDAVFCSISCLREFVSDEFGGV